MAKRRLCVSVSASLADRLDAIRSTGYKINVSAILESALEQEVDLVERMIEASKEED